MLHTASMSMPEISVPSSGRNKPPPRPFGGSLLIPETLLFELSAANSIPAFMFHRYSSMQSLRSSALIITGTPFTLFILHNSHSRSKNKFSVLVLPAIECGFLCMVISSECDRGRTLFCNFLLLLPTHQIRKESTSL